MLIDRDVPTNIERSKDDVETPIEDLDNLVSLRKSASHFGFGVLEGMERIMQREIRHQTK